MNIIEAIKSGRPFKRKNSKSWFFTNGIYSYSNDDIVADDWEVESPSVTIKRQQFYEAWAMASKIMGEKRNPDCPEMVELVAKELGL